MTFVIVAGAIAGVIALLQLGRMSRGDHIREANLERVKARLADAVATELRDGEVVAVVGIVRCAEPLVAPLSGRPCVAYHALLHVDVPGTPSHPIERSAVAAFELEVGAARHAVEASAFELAFPLEPVIPNDLARNHAFVEQAKVTRVLKLGSAYEAIVPVGAAVKVSAMVVHERAPASSTTERGYREGADVIRLVDRAKLPIVIGPA
nr:hypothetical protein [Kofleriaceae bacterium]